MCKHSSSPFNFKNTWGGGIRIFEKYHGCHMDELIASNSFKPQEIF